MAGFTKLHSSITTSSLLSEPLPSRWLWCILLALADADGVVSGTVPGLACAANIKTKDCRAGIECFLAPDPDSRTKDHDGRRLEVVDGVGWRILNYAKYRFKFSADERRDYKRQNKREQRERERRAHTSSTRAVIARVTPGTTT